MAPLDALLRAGMRLTIAFDDLSVPLPPMRPPDVRQRVIERVLERAYRAGVDDIHLIAAHGPAPPHDPRGARAAPSGPRVYDAFAPDRLYNHDAEDPEGNTGMGETSAGEQVTLNRRAAESDLVVYVHAITASLQGGSKSPAIGLGTYASIKAHHTVHTPAPLALLHRPEQLRAAPLGLPPGRRARGRRARLPRRGRAQQRHVRATRCASWPSPRRAGAGASRPRSPRSSG